MKPLIWWCHSWWRVPVVSNAALLLTIDSFSSWQNTVGPTTVKRNLCLPLSLFCLSGLVSVCLPWSQSLSVSVLVCLSVSLSFSVMFPLHLLPLPSRKTRESLYELYFLWFSSSSFCLPCCRLLLLFYFYYFILSCFFILWQFTHIRLGLVIIFEFLLYSKLPELNLSSTHSIILWWTCKYVSYKLLNFVIIFALLYFLSI